MRSAESAGKLGIRANQHGVSRREAREEKNVPASTHQIPSAAPLNGAHFRKFQKSFSLLDRARPVFSFSALRKGGVPAGAQRSGSGGERRKERSLSGIFGFSRKWSGGVSSDDMGDALPQPSSWLNPPRPSGRETSKTGNHPITPRSTWNTFPPSIWGSLSSSQQVMNTCPPAIRLSTNSCLLGSSSLSTSSSSSTGYSPETFR